MAEQWLSIVEYARTFAVSDMTIRRRIKNGKLQAVLKDGKYYIPVGAGASKSSVDLSVVEAPRPTAISVSSVRIASNSSDIQEEAPDNSVQAVRPGASYRTLPPSISSGVERVESTMVDSQALLQFCEHSVTRINSIERHLQENFHLRIQSLEAELRLKDAQIAQLKQQGEDLQMLVKLMEANPIKR